MLWIAPSEKDTDTAALEKRLWDAADQLRANSGLKSQEYSAPVLGLIFLRFAEVRFAAQRAKLEKASASVRHGSRVDEPAAYHAEGILYLPAEARFDYLLNRPEAENIGAKVNAAMRDIEKHNPQLAGVLPKTYNLFTSTLLKELLKKVSEIPASLDYDVFGRIYEYFLGEFAMSEGQGGGEFYTPSSIVRLLTEVIEPYHGRILDPACGSGGMFVSSARFVSEHKRQAAAGRHPRPSDGRGAGGEGLAAEYSGDPSRELSIHGVEKTDETGRLCRLNLAVHGLDGEIKHGGNINSYYDDPHDATGRFDFVLANPPFNVNAVDKERLKDQVGSNRRFAFGLPRTDNANYLWIQLFYSALNEKGRAGFVMANSASDARWTEKEIRRKLIECRAVDVMVAVGLNMFYTVKLPCTLWFFDKSKTVGRASPRADQVLFVDARHIYRQVDRAHRDWTPAQIGFLANLVRLYRGEALDFTLGGDEARAKLEEIFGNKPKYADVLGLCRAATLKEIKAQGWSLNPARYVGITVSEAASDEEWLKNLQPGVKLMRPLRGRFGFSGGISWSPDGRLLASPSEDKSIRLWDTETGACLRTLEATEHRVVSTAFDPQGVVLASGHFDFTIRLWDAINGRLLHSLETSCGPIYSVAFDPSSKTLACGLADGTLELFEVATWKLLRSLKTHSGLVDSIAFDPSGQTCATSGDDSTIKLWDTSDWRLLHRFEGDEGVHVAFGSGGRTLVGAGVDHAVQVWDCDSGHLLRKLEGHVSSVTRTSFLSDETLIASSSEDDTIRIWDSNTGACLAVILCSDPGGSLVAHPRRPLLATVGWDPDIPTPEIRDTIQIWELDLAILSGDFKEQEVYQSANVILVGDSGVGKTGLARVLSDAEFSGTPSTYGLSVRRFSSERTNAITREVLLWDLAGQRDFQREHHLNYQDASLALVLVDAVGGVDPLAAAEFWAKRLDTARGREPVIKFLVIARSDRGQGGISEQRFRSMLGKYGFTGYFTTSAKTGLGVQALSKAIETAIPWDSLPSITTSARMKRVRDFLVSHLCLGNQLRIDDSAKLRQRFIEEAYEDVSEEEFLAVLGRLSAAGIDQPSLSFTSAKVVLVGESKAGKSYLAHRITTGNPPQDGTLKTTHGMKFWPLKPVQLSPESVAPPGERREVVLWDMGGQEEYRLIHQLFLHDTTVALVLFDPTRGSREFEDVRTWNKYLEKQLRGRGAVKLLLGAKVDEVCNTIDRQGVERLVKECGFAGYYETSAITGRGLAEACKAVAKTIDWGALGKTSRPQLFQAIRDEIETRRRAGTVVVVFDDLDQELQTNEESEIFGLLNHEVAMASDAEAGTEALDGVCRQLAQQGMIAYTKTNSGEKALVLRIEEVERYAGSLILSARDNPRGAPALELRAIGHSTIPLPGIAENERLPRDQEKLVLECTVQLLLEHGICFQHEGLLIFPSLFAPSPETAIANPPHAVSLYYDFAGAVDNIYASLIASLVLAREFGRVRLWSDRAEFEVIDGGLCGLLKVSRPGGFAHVDVYFQSETPEHQRKEFISFVEDHLVQNGVEIREHVAIKCACGHELSEETLRQRIGRGDKDVVCPVCETRHSLTGGAAEARERDPGIALHTWALRTQIADQRERITKEVVQVLATVEVMKPATAPIRLLHLSDLHFNEETPVLARLQWLLDDLKQSGGLSFKNLDYLVIAGDFTDKGNPAGFEKAYDFVSGLAEEFSLSAERCIFVPGNHDVRDMNEAYEWRDKPDGLKEGEWVKQGEIILARNAEKYPLRFKPFSDSFFHKFVQRPYPLECAPQGMAIPFWEAGLQFLALNSCWQIDRFNRKRSGIHIEAVANAIKLAQKQEEDARKAGQLAPDKAMLKIAVWHHAVAGPEQMKDTEFLGNLQKNGVRLALHGDVHEERRDLIGSWHPKNLHVIGSGSFGARAQERPESTPRLYNVLEIHRDLRSARVHTRCQPKPDGPWDGWHEWPDPDGGKGRVAYYDINL